MSGDGSTVTPDDIPADLEQKREMMRNHSSHDPHPTGWCQECEYPLVQSRIPYCPIHGVECVAYPEWRVR